MAKDDDERKRITSAASTFVVEFAASLGRVTSVVRPNATASEHTTKHSE